MHHKPLFVFFTVLFAITMIADSGLSVGPYYEEYFTDGTTDLEWESAWYDSLGNPLTPMQVDFVSGNPSGDGWVGVIEADTVYVGGLGLATAGDTGLSDYIMEAEVWVDVDGGNSFYEGIMMRANEDTTDDVIEGYQLVSNFYSPFFLERIKFRKFNSIPADIRDLRVYDSSEIPGGVPSESGWHTMKIKAKGNKFWLYWDGIEFPDNPQEDTTQVPLSSGKFGIYCFNMSSTTEVLSDDIIVSPSTLTLTGPDPGSAGTNNTLSVSGATPGERVYFGYALRQGTTNVPGCTGETIELRNPKIIGFEEADSFGEASITVFVPGGASGRTVLFQAAELTNCLISNLVTHPFP
jgi:hypothetical protein